MSTNITYDVRLRHPSTVLISGVSRSGKTDFSRTMLENASSMFQPSPPRYVILVCEEWQKIYDYLIE